MKIATVRVQSYNKGKIFPCLILYIEDGYFQMAHSHFLDQVVIVLQCGRPLNGKPHYGTHFV